MPTGLPPGALALSFRLCPLSLEPGLWASPEPPLPGPSQVFSPALPVPTVCVSLVCFSLSLTFQLFSSECVRGSCVFLCLSILLCLCLSLSLFLSSLSLCCSLFSAIYLYVFLCLSAFLMSLPVHFCLILISLCSSCLSPCLCLAPIPSPRPSLSQQLLILALPGALSL